MQPQLDDYQLEAVGKLRTGCVLKGGVGSGKSRTGLAYYFCKVCGGLIDGKDWGFDQDYVPMTKPIDLYIITTARKRDQGEWEDELNPFLLSTKKEHNLYSDKMTVTVDSWNNIRKYADVCNAFFIFDEQKAIGAGPWAKAFIKIAKHNQWILMSATPGDVWTDYVPTFIANGFYKNRTEFYNRHVVYSRYSKYPKIDKYLEERRLEQLRDSILVNMDYKNPTTRHYETISVEYDRAQYKALMSERWNVFEQKPIENISELCYLLRKVVNSDESRQLEVLKLAEDHPRVIVFYNFDYELDILKGLGYMPDTVIAEWNGHKHELVPESERWVYLVQYFSGAEAWNCTETDTMIFYSPSYSYKAMEQAAGRIDRRNTPFKDLYYYSFRTHASIDVAIARSLSRKKNFNERSFFYKK